MSTRINHLAVWLLVVAHQLIGFGWYAVFGDLWLKYHAKTMTDIERPHDFTPFIVAIIASIAVNYALAWRTSGQTIGRDCSTLPQTALSSLSTRSNGSNLLAAMKR